MTLPEKRNGPAGIGSVPESLTTTARLHAHSTADGPQSRAATRDPIDAAGILAGVYVTVVRVDGEHYRRRVYLSLAPAEAAARRAESRGHVAEVVLCRLEPVGGAR